MTIKAIALDDEPPALNVIKRFSQQTGFIDLIRTFSKAEEAAVYLSGFPVDLVFLDINMPAISGIEFKKRLPPQLMVVFTTAYTEYAIDGFNLNAVDYLLKPFTQERFTQAAEKARTLFQFQQQSIQQKPDHIMVRVDYSLVRLELADILFIEGLDDYLKIYMTNNKTLVIRMTMKAMADKLPATDFVRVHRSYTVAIKKIESVRNKAITIGEEIIPVGAIFDGRLQEILGRQIN